MPSVSQDRNVNGKLKKSTQVDFKNLSGQGESNARGNGYGIGKKNIPMIRGGDSDTSEDCGEYN